MAKEWVLNSATNRFQLNFKSNLCNIVHRINRSVLSIMDWLYLLRRFDGNFCSSLLDCMLPL